MGSYHKKSRLNFKRLFVIRIGFEPMTYCLEGSCSIQLSYRTCLAAAKKGFFTLTSASYAKATINKGER